jgi:multimeric flavodoxin WrbA
VLIEEELALKTAHGWNGVLGILGSPRRNGNSAALLREVLGHLDTPCQTETVFLAEQDIRPCEGCHACEEDGICPISDDMPALSDRLRRARAIVVATPCYMGGVTSRLQTFMERAWSLRKGELAGKLGTYIVTGRRRIGAAVGVVEEFFTRLGCIKLPGVLGFGFEVGDIAGDREALERAADLVATLGRYLEPTEEWAFGTPPSAQ